MSIPVLWSAVILPRLQWGLRGRTAANAAFATGYAAAFGSGSADESPSDSSSRNGARCDGLAWGATLSLSIFAGYAALLTIPSTRARLAEFASREPEVGLAEWILVHIPLGTVYTEELIFRATLGPLLDRACGRSGIWLGASTFGLWHIIPARAAGDSVPATVAATALGGLILSSLRRRTGSTLAPALVHFALNAGGAIAPHLAGRLPPRGAPTRRKQVTAAKRA
ncbi:CPBP family intramembrane glutamic endopeptidase [Nocardia albiluteola]|uniref:CPBP family intramembrane glutamic endopeptidase n=1 Tax=Nocardia albiluteola TaxID=2842303 RepID=UPI0027E15372|nr:CPBP family intramembrane glutamic endopeptidase [Nocardia albiluteola]